MAPGYRNSGSVSPTGAHYHCLADYCNYKTDRHTDLKRHYKAKHPGPRDEVFQCSYKSCTKEFKRKDHLRDHSKRVHYRDLPAEYGGTGKRLSR
ncbi:MAG: nucleic acid binding [Ramalina farinacea]|uniref:Nucleic acid binding n=1 Tax=Ramalina farinacea TaxID=258253 RepID=A0AA43TNB2_9LECA|nr:nucleic acid binding [Ramalina farinacea]